MQFGVKKAVEFPKKCAYFYHKKRDSKITDFTSRLVTARLRFGLVKPNCYKYEVKICCVSCIDLSSSHWCILNRWFSLICPPIPVRFERLEKSTFKKNPQVFHILKTRNNLIYSCYVSQVATPECKKCEYFRNTTTVVSMGSGSFR